MLIKKVFKQDTNAEYFDVKESIEVGSGLVEEVVVETVKEPFEVESRLVVHRYVVKDLKENDDDKKCLLISNEIFKGGNASKEGNGWFENQITETSDKSKMDSGYVMRKNKELLGFVWKLMVRMRMNGSIMSGNYCVSGITRESKVTDESITLAELVSLYQPSDDLCELLTSSLGVIVGKRVETENGSSRATLMAMKTMIENVVGSIKRNQLEDLFVVQLEVIKKAEYRQSHAKVRKNILLKIPLCAIGTTLHDYAHMAAKATGEFMVKIEQVFDLGGEQVFDLWGFGNELVFSKQELAMNWKSRVAAFVASHVLVKKSSLQKECDIEFIRNLDGNKDIICLNENIDIMGSHFWKSDVVELMLVSDTQIKSIVEPMSVSDMRVEVFKNVVKSFACCYPQWNFVADIEIGWKLDKRLKSIHTIPSASAMKSSFEVDVIRESSAANQVLLANGL
nr:carbamoyl-phosphate synthase B [Tanacetum cinerariifolium]